MSFCWNMRAALLLWRPSPPWSPPSIGVFRVSLFPTPVHRVSNECPLVFIAACPPSTPLPSPPTGRPRPAHVPCVPRSVHLLTFKFAGTSRPHLNLQLRGGFAVTPPPPHITLSFRGKVMRSSAQPAARLRTALWKIRSSVHVYFPGTWMTKRINEEISLGVYLLGTDFPNVNSAEEPPPNRPCLAASKANPSTWANGSFRVSGKQIVSCFLIIPCWSPRDQLISCFIVLSLTILPEGERRDPALSWAKTHTKKRTHIQRHRLPSEWVQALPVKVLTESSNLKALCNCLQGFSRH